MTKEELRRERMGDEWYEILKDEFFEPYMKRLASILIEERKHYTIYPSNDNMFRAFKVCPFSKTKVVFLGQDPYPSEDANGVAFASSIGMPVSLKLMFNAMFKDFGFGTLERDTDLKYLTKQGCLFLNTRLTVRKNDAGSHANQGWEFFIARVIQELVDRNKNMIFVAVGNEAFKLLNGHTKISAEGKEIVIDNVVYRNNLIVAEHPAYAARLNREWKHNDCFRTVNHYLARRKLEPIIW